VRGIFLKYGNANETYGFIVPEQAEIRTQCSGENVFFHASYLREGSRRPVANDILEFTLVLNDRGWQALDAVVVSG